MSSRLLGISPGPTTAPSDGTKWGDLLTHRSDPGCNPDGRERRSHCLRAKLKSDVRLGREQQVAERTPGQSLVPTSWRQVPGQFWSKSWCHFPFPLVHYPCYPSLNCLCSASRRNELGCWAAESRCSPAGLSGMHSASVQGHCPTSLGCASSSLVWPWSPALLGGLGPRHVFFLQLSLDF